MRAIFVLPAVVVFGTLAGFGQQLRAQIAVGPAPSGEPTVVAQTVIQQNFPRAVCRLVIQALRLGDGSIRARCSNGEVFRVARVDPVGPVAMRCSAAVTLGIGGC